MTPAELLERLCEVHGVANLNQLASKIGYEPSTLYRWRTKHEPNFAHTIELLKRAGALNLEADGSQPPDLERLEQALEELTGLLRRIEPLAAARAQGPRRARRPNGRP